MAENSNIEWCNHTFNPWTGCTKVSEGCKHCYAESWAKRSGIVQWGPGQQRRRTSAANWKEPLKWNREAGLAWENWTCAVEARAGDSGPMPTRPRVFCASLADWLDDAVPIEWLADLLALIHATQHLDWQMLTKRPQNWTARMKQVRDYWLEITPCGSDECAKIWWLAAWIGNVEAPANVWLGTTAENQARADERIPLLLNIPAKVRFLSCEPLLGPLDLRLPQLRGAMDDPRFGGNFKDFNEAIHWVIAGGESGPGARPMHPEWARSLRNQCSAADVPFLFKQWGEWLFPPAIGMSFDDFPKAARAEVWTETGPGSRKGYDLVKVGKKAAGRLLDGIEHNGFPYPEGRAEP